eukprot:1161345-Pelagomonas_calceolata.AAC.12
MIVCATFDFHLLLSPSTPDQPQRARLSAVRALKWKAMHAGIVGRRCVQTMAGNACRYCWQTMCADNGWQCVQTMCASNGRKCV